MIGRRRDDADELDSADGASSPWATDQIVAGPAPAFDWDPPPEQTDDESVSTREPGRRNQILIAVGCVAALMIAALVLWPRGDDPLDDADDGDEAAAELDTLPDIDAGTDTEPDEDEPDTEPEADDSDDQIFAGTPAAVGGEVTSIELPPAIAAITQPTEIVMLADGDIVTLSLPSGNVRRSPGGPSLNEGGGFVVTDDAVAWFGGSDLSIVPRTGPPLSVDIGEGVQGGYVMDAVTDESGSSSFLVETYGSTDNQQYTVSVDGGIEPYEPDVSQIDTFVFFGGLRSGAGTDIVNDAGGVYVIGADDQAERISEGRALASNEDFVFLRECDETLACGFSVLELATGEQRISPVTTDELGASYGYDLAPDGSATLTTDFGNQQRRLVDLVDGTSITETGLASNFGRNTQWAADSSGVFRVDPGGTGITFVDRTTGESIAFGDELGRISELGVRMPDSELDPVENVIEERTLTFSEELTDPIGVDLVVLGDLGSMGYLDLDAATAAVWSVPSVTGSNDPDLFASGASVAVLPAGPRPGFVAELGTMREMESTAPTSPRFPGPLPGLVWSAGDGSDGGVDHRLLAVDGSEPATDGGAVELANSELLGDDGTGRLVARVGGAVFVVGVDDTERLTDGEVLALGPNHALVRSCDDELACSVQRVRRSDGLTLEEAEPSPSPEVAAVLDVLRPVTAPGRSPRLGGTMSPDGGAAFVRATPIGNASQWLMVDFDAGGRFEVPAPVDGQPIVWNDDGSVAVYLGEDGVHVVERSSGLVSTIEGLGEVRAITAVDPEFAAGGS